MKRLCAIFLLSLVPLVAFSQDDQQSETRYTVDFPNEWKQVSEGLFQSPDRYGMVMVIGLSSPGDRETIASSHVTRIGESYDEIRIVSKAERKFGDWPGYCVEISASRNKGRIVSRYWVVLLSLKDGYYVFQAMAPEPVFARYKPTFEQAISSLRAEPRAANR